jgi:fused signal recognition particle receptor
MEMDTPERKSGFFGNLRIGLERTRRGFVENLDRLLTRKSRLDAQTLEEIEELLITADLGYKTTTWLIEDVQQKVHRVQQDQLSLLRQCIKDGILHMLEPVESPLEIQNAAPFVMMAIGVNGVGKTTCIAKIAKQWRDHGQAVMLVAADTFRAAAIEQLQILGERIGVDVIKQKHGSDPSAVVFDALKAAQARAFDLVILDTAGRLHTKANLMDELKKIKRVAGKVMAGAPHEVLLVLDATTGQNALSQARMFHDAMGVTGIAITKLDGTAKGGILVSVASELGIPMRYVGVGEAMEDLQVFQAQAFVNALFEEAHIEQD